ncbi:MAG: hypothetical protein DRN57_01465 [Thermoplasmata archaeon]|nr:MAG: hypothetical protein DRN57_01465 [Thermoplasmata archaeon]
MVNKDALERYIVDKKEVAERLDIRKRDIELTTSKEFIQVIYGPRRAGKSYLFLYNIRKKKIDEVLYLNFDDIRLDGWKGKDIYDSVPVFMEIFGRGPEMIMLDEVQNVDGWEKAVLTLYESKRYDIFLTGSSSKLLAKEIDTSLRGRSLKQPLYPLSFSEYLRFKNKRISVHPGTDEIIRIRSQLDEYLRYGSFPGIVRESDSREGFYEDYIDLVIYRDLVERYGISNLGVLKFLIRNILRSYSKEFSLNKLYNTWTSMRYEAGKKTFYQYMRYLEDVGFAILVRKFSRTARSSSLSVPKVYLPDTGLAFYVMGDQIGREMENAVLVELLRRNSKRAGMDVFYWKDHGLEIDFIICRRGEPVEIIQVTHSINPENEKRELAPLEKFRKEHGGVRTTMITWTGEEDGPDWVSIVPMWKFLLGKG